MAGNSADRRRQRRSEEQSHRIRIVLWCLAGVMALVLWFLPSRNEIGTTIGLIALASLLVYPVLSMSYIRLSTGGYSVTRRIFGMFVIAVAVFIFGLFVWPPAGLGELSVAENNQFMNTLKTQGERIPVHIMCPPNEERECVVASQFISIFERSGWQVIGKKVDRVFNGTPRAGFYFVLHSTMDPDPANSEGKTGAWTKIPRGYFTVKTAFDALIKTNMVVGASYPDGELGLYFGVGTAKP